jgi:hypothetical protein
MYIPYISLLDHLGFSTTHPARTTHLPHAPGSQPADVLRHDNELLHAHATWDSCSMVLPACLRYEPEGPWLAFRISRKNGAVEASKAFLSIDYWHLL